MKSDSSTTLYYFKDRKLTKELELKGDTYENGYVILDNECKVKNLSAQNKNLLYDENKSEIEDYMLDGPKLCDTEFGGNTYKIPCSLFEFYYKTKYAQIVSISFIDNITIPSNAIEVLDISFSKQGKVKSWLIPNGSNYDLFIGSEGKIFANFDTSNLFSQLKATNYNLSNFYTAYTSNFNAMFQYTKASSINLSNLKTNN